MVEKQGEHISDPDNKSWVSWGNSIESALKNERTWLDRTQLQMFRFIAGLATLGLGFIFVRGVIVGGPFPFADLMNGLFFGLLIIMSFLRPQWLKCFMWLGLLSFFVNSIEGFRLWPDDVVAPFHLLLPLFVLYGALLGDIRLSLTAVVGVLAIYAYTWFRHSGEFDRRNILMLTNLCVAAFISGVATLGVWLHHCRLVKKLDQQTKRLRSELETRLRIQTMITHDIRNPLMTLLHASVLDDPPLIQSMAEHISEIVRSATGLSSGSKISASTVLIKEVWGYITETFSVKLTEKEQMITTRGDEHLEVLADLKILCNSILGNFISNAIKFSPHGSTIEIVAEPVGDFVRIAVYDQGPGLSSDLVQAGMNDGSYKSRLGTDGEVGTGYGLRIAALCAARMNGRLEIKNCDHGGALSVLLPCS